MHLCVFDVYARACTCTYVRHTSAGSEHCAEGRFMALEMPPRSEEIDAVCENVASLREFSLLALASLLTLTRTA